MIDYSHRYLCVDLLTIFMVIVIAAVLAAFVRYHAIIVRNVKYLHYRRRFAQHEHCVEWSWNSVARVRRKVSLLYSLAAYQIYLLLISFCK